VTVLYDAFHSAASARLDKCAVRTADGAVISYAKLLALVGGIAGGLRRAGVREGHTIATSLGNSPGYVALILATARIGASYVPMIREFGQDDVETALALTRATLMVVDGSRPELRAAIPHVGLDELSAADPLPYGEPHRPSPGVFRYLWTSGSTGFPKLMSWRQDKFLAERQRWIAHTGPRDTDVFFCRHTLDVAHATDLHLFAALLAGAELVLADVESTPYELLTHLSACGATVMSALPRHYEQLVQAARAGACPDLTSLRLPFCGGTYLSPAVVRDCADILGVRIRQLFGSTEFGLAAVNLDDVVQDEGAMPLVPGVCARLVPLSPDTADIGELVLRSPWTSEGYLNDLDAHARTFRDGEYWTGDIARRDGDGRYRILGRASETLRSSHGPICTPMLDADLVANCPVAESVSLATRPGAYDENVLVVARPRDVPDADAVASIGSRLDHHGLVGDIHIVDAIPYTAVGKPDKALLRERVASGPLVRRSRRAATGTMVIVPGWGMTARYFDRAVADLRTDHDVITMDLRGHGAGPPAPPDWTIGEAAEDVHDLIERRDLHGITLIGWSLGAGVAYSYLHRFGTDRVSRLVSIEMSPRLLSEDGWEHAAFGGLDRAGARDVGRSVVAERDSFLEGLVRNCFAVGTEPDQDLLNGLIAESKRCTATALQALWTDALAQDWRTQITRITVPTLLMHGAKSQIFPTDIGKWMADAMADATLVTFADSGHLPFIEETEKFVSELRKFSAGRPGEHG
jgi:acyl-coenzyme A synthetase/AMP-(fatty) acid ligase/alpha-beta hydrolase superfamily lysophospholipase